MAPDEPIHGQDPPDHITITFASEEQSVTLRLDHAAIHALLLACKEAVELGRLGAGPDLMACFVSASASLIGHCEGYATAPSLDKLMPHASRLGLFEVEVEAQSVAGYPPPPPPDTPSTPVPDVFLEAFKDCTDDPA